MNDIEHLHQLILNIAARLQATEAIANAAIAVICATDDTEKAKERFLKEVFPTLLLNAINAPSQATKPELDAWMRQREQDFLNVNLQKIISLVNETATFEESPQNGNKEDHDAKN